MVLLQISLRSPLLGVLITVSHDKKDGHPCHATSWLVVHIHILLMIIDKAGSLVSWSNDGVVLNKSPLVGNNFEGRP
jgi:hypothetical protein